MDECLGSFMSLWPFTDALPAYIKMTADTKRTYLNDIAKRLAFNTNVWLFRPDLDPLLAALVQAKESGQITGCFILTNNGSLEIAEVVRRILNLRAAALKTGTPRTPHTSLASQPKSELFVVSWHRAAPCRKRHGLAKSIECVQDCLAATGLPTLTRIQDLLFFDDYPDHVLAKQIPHYVTVDPYINYTPLSLVYKELRGIVGNLGIEKAVVDAVLEKGHSLEEKDIKKEKLNVYPPSPSKAERIFLVEKFAEFLQSSPRSVKRTAANTRKTGTTARSKTRRARQSKN
jgi:hypothetical protein